MWKINAKLATEFNMALTNNCMLIRLYFWHETNIYTLQKN